MKNRAIMRVLHCARDSDEQSRRSLGFERRAPQLLIQRRTFHQPLAEEWLPIHLSNFKDRNDVRV